MLNISSSSDIPMRSYAGRSRHNRRRWPKRAVGRKATSRGDPWFAGSPLLNTIAQSGHERLCYLGAKEKAPTIAPASTSNAGLILYCRSINSVDDQELGEDISDGHPIRRRGRGGRGLRNENGGSVIHDSCASLPAGDSWYEVPEWMTR